MIRIDHRSPTFAQWVLSLPHREDHQHIPLVFFAPNWFSATDAAQPFAHHTARNVVSKIDSWSSTTLRRGPLEHYFESPELRVKHLPNTKIQALFWWERSEWLSMARGLLKPVRDVTVVVPDHMSFEQAAEFARAIPKPEKDPNEAFKHNVTLIRMQPLSWFEENAPAMERTP